MTLSRVVLPQPDAPRATTNSFSRNSKLMSSSAWTLPRPWRAGNSIETWLRLMTAVMDA